MKVARASQADIDAAQKLFLLLNAVDDGFFPSVGSDDEDPIDFDQDDKDDLQKFLRVALDCFNRPPSGLMRVLYAATCALDPANKMYDLSQNHLAFHPRIEAAEKLLAAVTEWEASPTTGNEVVIKEAAAKLREVSA